MTRRGETIHEVLSRHFNGLAPEDLVVLDRTFPARMRPDLQHALQEVLSRRPETLERALASRPGRIDQAIEFPLPEEEGRRKLVRLYGCDLELEDGAEATIVRRTEGVSAAFLKELMRRTAQFLLERNGGRKATLADVDAALEEMLFAGGSLNRTLLGAPLESRAPG